MRSVFENSPKKIDNSPTPTWKASPKTVNNSITPAWKARLSQRGNNLSEKSPIAKPPITKTPIAKPPIAKPPVAKPPVAKPPIQKPTIQKSMIQKSKIVKPTIVKPTIVKPTISKPVVPVKDSNKDSAKNSEKSESIFQKLAKAKKEKKEAKKAKKAMKKEKKMKEQSKDTVAQNNELEILRHSQRNNDLMLSRHEPRNSDLMMSRHSHSPSIYEDSEALQHDENIANLRKQVQEMKSRLENFDRDTKQQYANMKKEHSSEKQDMKIRLMKLINAQGKKNDAAFQEYKKIADNRQKELDVLRVANRGLRATLEKVPQQKAEVILSNQRLEEANEEVARVTKSLEKFYKKLQTDHEKIVRASDKCKNEYLPRHRQQLWESGNHVDGETKMKNLYRDCLLKIANHVDSSGQRELYDQISSMVLEVEEAANPKFDPKVLSRGDIKYDLDDDDSCSSIDDSISISSTESESDSE